MEQNKNPIELYSIDFNDDVIREFQNKMENIKNLNNTFINNKFQITLLKDEFQTTLLKDEFLKQFKEEIEFFIYEINLKKSSFFFLNHTRIMILLHLIQFC